MLWAMHNVNNTDADAKSFLGALGTDLLCEIRYTWPPPAPIQEEEDAEEDTKDDDPAYTSRYLPVDAFVRITKEVCQFPTFFNAPLYRRILDLWHAKHNDAGADSVASRIPALDLNATETTDSADEANAAAGRGMEVVTYGMFKWYWTTEMEEYDASERFFRLIKQPDAEYIVRDDFLPYIQELLKDHPGLEFLSNHAEFQEKYAITVSEFLMLLLSSFCATSP